MSTDCILSESKHCITMLSQNKNKKCQKKKKTSYYTHIHTYTQQQNADRILYINIHINRTTCIKHID